MAGGRFRPPCKFFLQGTCRNGDSCRFNHEAPFGGGGGGNRNQQQNTRNVFGGNSSSGFGGNGGATGGGAASAAAAGSTMTDATRSVAIEELRVPPLWELSGFSVTKGVRLCLYVCMSVTVKGSV